MSPATPRLPISPLSLDGPEWNLLRQRDALRLAMLERRFEEVEQILGALEHEWWQATDEDLVSYEYLVRAPALFDFATVPADVRVECLQAWNTAFPESYHARLVLGRYYYGRAGDIRTAAWASQVSQAQWLAAAMACARAAEYLLESIALSARPAIAAKDLMEMSRHFDEPAFVDALFRGETPEAPPSRDDVGPQLYDAALALLKHYAIVPQQHFPTSLPAGLPTRVAGEAARPADYWLRFAAQVKPAWPGLLASYANYLTLRWGGEPGEVEKFAKGPLCASLTEQQLSVVRWPGVNDALSEFPEQGNTRAIATYEKAMERWLAGKMPDYVRFIAMGSLANFTTYSLGDHEKALQRHAASVRYCHAPYVYTDAEGTFRDYARLMLMFGFADEEGAFKQVLERAVRWFDEPTMLAIAAVAYRFGLWDIAPDHALAASLIERTAELAPIQQPSSFTPLAVCRMLWDGEQHDASVYLASELAERRVYEASAFMYDVRRGWLPDTEAHHLDEAQSLHWLERAAEEGISTALYNQAYRLEKMDGMDLSQRGNFERVRELYQQALEQGLAMALIRRTSLLRRFGTEQEKQQAVADMKVVIADEDYDDLISGEAYGEIVLAYKYGDGVPRSEYIAMQWFDRFKELHPEHSTLEWLESQVYGDSGWQMAGRALRAFFGAKPSAEHLPPR
ncbi:DUF4034 domain-containing protein [Dyella sp. LX-66]|uniref:DUF4034 domain-containing protein n=1 Tax=unclassified Dyella TaxID=2634549 RepID=UPI001BDFA722|nr:MULTISPECIES: DUF4034 domain-containing protein [unclassified Dyella]MBT2116630.1 DUF4034 domain-containing protein [Dyella sp. LX-1]MBT2139190.1 DUF4034 domain-containing protein [Dyella sp. LX-66]